MFVHLLLAFARIFARNPKHTRMQYRMITLVSAAALALAACGDASTAPEAEVSDAVEAPAQGPVSGQATQYAVNPNASKVSWVGSKLVGDAHTGTIDISDGRLAVFQSEIAGGDFTLDMGSLTVTDLDDNSGKGKLEGHLKNEDFFEVNEYPEATFTITRIQPIEGRQGVTHELTGNLELKGVTKSVTVPAEVSITDEEITAVTPAFTINRTDWNVKYGSGITGVAQDKIISDDVELKIMLSAERT